MEVEYGDVGSLKGAQAHKGLRFHFPSSYERNVSFFSRCFQVFYFTGCYFLGCILPSVRCASPPFLLVRTCFYRIFYIQGGGSEHPVCMLFPHLPLGEGLTPTNIQQGVQRYPTSSLPPLLLPQQPNCKLGFVPQYHKLRPTVNKWFLLIACIGEAKFNAGQLH